MKNLVIDCNVFISAFIGSDTCFQVLDKAFSDHRVCYSDATLKELLETLKRSSSTISGKLTALK